MSTNFNSDKIRSIKLKDKIYNIVGQPLHGTAAEWDNNPLYIPAQGEIVIYDIDDNNDKSKFKIGDGETTVANLPFFTCDNGGDEKEIYGVDANKDGNVELIFGAKPLSIFTITYIRGYMEGIFNESNPYTFQFEDGMTWHEWFNSSYCPFGSDLIDINSDDTISIYNSGLYLDDSSTKVYIFDEPIAGVDPAARDVIFELILNIWHCI